MSLYLSVFLFFSDPNIQILAAPSNCQKGYKSFQQGCYKISTDGNYIQTIRVITSSLYLLASFQILAAPNNCQKGCKSFQQGRYKISTDGNYIQTIRVISLSIYLLASFQILAAPSNCQKGYKSFQQGCYKISTDENYIQTIRVITFSVCLLAFLQHQATARKVTNHSNKGATRSAQMVLIYKQLGSFVYLLASFQILVTPGNCQKGYQSFQQGCYKISTGGNNIHRGSQMSAHFLWIFKRILVLFCNKFDTFNNTGVRM